MNSHRENPFGTIESAHEFVKLLAKAVRDAKRELETDVARESASEKSRRLDALRMALYSLSKLETHMGQSSRILNDLRSLRRLLLAEREFKRKAKPQRAGSLMDERASTASTETKGRIAIDTEAKHMG
jgi:hypothetical protein